MRLNVPRFAAQIHALFTTVADQAAQDSGWLKRKRKLTGASFVRTLVFGYLDNPDASLEDFAEELDVSSQAVDQRFGSAAADCLRRVLRQALLYFWSARAEPIPALRRFTAVVVDDGTSVSLPAELADDWPACGGDGSAAGIKLFTRLEVTTGTLLQLEEVPARTSDHRCGRRWEGLPAGALWLRDLGFFDLGELAEADRRGIDWISRVPAQLSLRRHDQDQDRPLVEVLKRARGEVLDLSVRLGTKSPLSCRLVAMRVPPEVAAERLRALHATARRKGRAVSDAQRILAQWTVFITNLPAETYDFDALWTLYRVRWQIELLFKRWKSLVGLGRSRGRRGARRLCELYAKLLAALVQHGGTMLRSGPLGAVSPTRAAWRVRRAARGLAVALSQGLDALIRRLERLESRLKKLPKRPRRQRPSTRQLLYGLRLTA
jgi:hypothetical protein